jgi:hypothetical protein
LAAKQQPQQKPRPATNISSPYNLPRRRDALFEIRRLIVDEGLSHQEIQLRLNLSPRTYFRYLDLLFKAEQEAIEGNNYTYQRLLNESLILNQRYLRRAKMLTAIGNDEKVDSEQRIEAHKLAAELERAVHDMSYMAPSYLRRLGLLPLLPKGNFPALSMSKIEGDEEQDPYENERIEAAGEYRRQQQQLKKKIQAAYDELDYAINPMTEEDEEEEEESA